MSQKPSYFKIGLFVIAACLLLALGIIIFGGGKFFEKKFTVETYFDQSVQGLNVGAALKFQGVQIGNVSYMGCSSGRKFIRIKSTVKEARIIRTISKGIQVWRI
jgi:ABC-type transporter Mla subunit MlaD